jgi:alpha-1,2-mannosyltransferase
MVEAQTGQLFDGRRVRLAALVLISVQAVSLLGLVLTSQDFIDLRGRPLGYDFITFWSASFLTLAGKAASAFDMKALYEAQRHAIAGETIFLWHYPPTNQLLVSPLALLPYLLSYLLFIGATLAAYVFSLRRLVPTNAFSSLNASLLLLAFPIVLICIFHGQNSFLSAALFAGGILLARDKPWAAGICLGLLAYKPQLGLLLPLAFVVSGQWRLFVATGTTAVAFAGMATLAFGFELWRAFFNNAPFVREIMESGFLPWPKMPSAFIFFRYLGAPEFLAYGVQVLSAVGAAMSVGLVWYRIGMTPLAWAVLIVATLLLPPYLFDYEFVLLALPLLLLANDMVKNGASRSEKAALVIFFLLPGAVAAIAEATHLQIGFPMLVALLAFCVRRACVIQSRQDDFAQRA